MAVIAIIVHIFTIYKMKHLEEIKDWKELINTVVCGDCLEGMKLLPDKCIDLVLTDPPYGITRCDWDTAPDLPVMWDKLYRAAKSNSPYVVFASQPFTSDLIQSNRRGFKYDIIWDKKAVTNIGNAKKQPLRNHETICVFYEKPPTYNPQLRPKGGGMFSGRKASKSKVSGSFGGMSAQENRGYPKSIWQFMRPNNLTGGGLHPTQKPLALLEELIKTYSNPGDLVLDPFMGSWTTARACKDLGRDFIGFELSEDYCRIGEKRLRQEILF